MTLFHGQHAARPAANGRAGSSGPSATRIYALDLTRLAAMLMMIQGHTLDALVNPVQLDIGAFPWNIWHFIRGLTAPIFLLVSGAVHVFANKRDANGQVSHGTFWRRIRWGITLIGIAYLWAFPAGSIEDLGNLSAANWQHFYQVNILHLTGAALCLLMLLIMTTRSTAAFARLSLAVGLGIALVTPLVHTVNWHALLPAVLANYLSFDGGSLFPFFPYASYLFFGVRIGRYLQDKAPEQRLDALIRQISLAGLGFFAVSVLLTMLPFSIYPEHSYWLSNPVIVLMRTGLAMLFMGLMGLLYKHTASMWRHYLLLGSKAIHIYIAHLLLLFGTPWLASVGKLYERSMSLYEGAGIALAIMLVCIAYVYLLDYWQRRSVLTLRTVQTTAVCVVLYALLF